MTNRTDTTSSQPRKRFDIEDGSDICRVRLVNVSSGVAAGRTRRMQGNAYLEYWALFMSREQFNDCATADPLRFSDPLLFAQIKREFNDVFDQSHPVSVHKGTGSEA